MNKKWINRTLTCETYFSFEGVSSNQQTVTAKIWLSLCRNTMQTIKTTHYDWFLISNRDISDKYMIILRNKFNAFLEISKTLTPDEKYENFINAHIETATECMPTKLEAKHRIPLETLMVKKKWDNVKTAFLCNKKNPTNANAQKLKKAQIKQINVYQKEQIEYFQGQINKIWNSVEDRQFYIAWQRVNEVNKTKITSRAKLKSASQKERIHMWKEHFKIPKCYR